jgi:hypothetical protein
MLSSKLTCLQDAYVFYRVALISCDVENHPDEDLDAQLGDACHELQSKTALLEEDHSILSGDKQLEDISSTLSVNHIIAWLTSDWRNEEEKKFFLAMKLMTRVNKTLCAFVL